MRIFVGVTDIDWATFLRGNPEITEANFWRSAGQDFRALAPGEPFLFKTKAPQNRIVGGGYFSRYFERRVSEAWEIWGTGNGVATLEEFEAKIQEQRAGNGHPYMPDPTIGCVALDHLFFGGTKTPFSQPPHWGRGIQRGRGYTWDDEDWPYVEMAFDVLRGEERLDIAWDGIGGVSVIGAGPRYGRAREVRPRLGQQAFKQALLDAYGRRCAITGSKLEPALVAAHIRPYAKGGEHRVDNGMLLRADVHALFDGGYLGVDPDTLGLRVSPRLRSEFGNGDWFYDRATSGEPVATPASRADRPDPEALAWHLASCFKAAA